MKNRKWKDILRKAAALGIALTAAFSLSVPAGLLTGCGVTPKSGSSAAAESTSGSGDSSRQTAASSGRSGVRGVGDKSIPKYHGRPYVVVRKNEPRFKQSQMSTKSFEKYGALDRLGRCTACFVNVSRDTMPRAERGDISSVHPTGWQSGMRWERCHLIGYQLTGENANERNLITGTHYLNIEGMLGFENQVADYVKETGNHVLYRVTPVFRGDNLVASGVYMEARSVEDRGEGVSFYVYCFNVTPGASINYRTGLVVQGSGTGETGSENRGSSANDRKEKARTYVLNTNRKVFHYPSCASVRQIKAHNRKTVKSRRSALIREGYRPCGNCEP